MNEWTVDGKVDRKPNGDNGRMECRTEMMGEKRTSVNQCFGIQKKNVLHDYNQLFKRIEAVQLKHKWESDGDDGVADVTDSDDNEGNNDDNEGLPLVGNDDGNGSLPLQQPL